MNQKITPKYQVILFAVISLTILLGCNFTSPSTPATTPDIAATAQAAVSATAQANQNIQATINASVIMTATAMPAAPTPTPYAQINYYTLTEEELAAMIDEAVNEAVTASQQATSSTSQATSDYVVSTEEITTVVVTVDYAEALIGEVEGMMAAYYELYGAYASQTLAELQQIEQDLAAISSSLNEVTAIMEQGAEAASAAVEQLNSAVQAASDKASEAQQQAQSWLSNVQSELGNRENQMLSLQPNQVASDRAGAILSLHDYTGALKNALGDNKISPDELMNIAQLGANANASIKLQGGPQMAGFTDQINNFTRKAARGQAPTMSRELPSFEQSLPKRR